MDQASLSGGFTDPPTQSAEAFRGLMQAMARPGTIQGIVGTVPPAPLSVAAGTTLMTLCDPDTGICLTGAFDCAPLRDWIAFHTGAPVVKAPQAAFVLGTWDSIDLGALPIGTPEYPDRSATVIVEMDALTATGATLRGPGIKNTAALNVPDIAALQRNAARFPLGVDFIFTSGAQVAALPRTTQVTPCM